MELGSYEYVNNIQYHCKLCNDAKFTKTFPTCYNIQQTHSYRNQNYQTIVEGKGRGGLKDVADFKGNRALGRRVEWG